MTFRSVALAALLCALPSLAAAPAKAPAGGATEKDLAKWPPRPFSADMLITPKKEGASPLRQHVFFSQGRMRMEMEMGGQLRAVVTDMVKKKAFMLMPQQKMALDMSGAMDQARDKLRQLTPQQLAGSGGDICANVAEGQRCKKLGSEKVNGRAATKWQLTEKDGKTSTVWLDDALVVMLRHESDQGTVEMQNLKEGPQADALFQVPADFKVMAHPAGMPGGHTK